MHYDIEQKALEYIYFYKKMLFQVPSVFHLLSLMDAIKQTGMEESTVIATGKVHLSNPSAIYCTHIRSQILQL